MTWRFVGSCFANEPFLLDEFNVWDYSWEPVNGMRFANLGSRSCPDPVPVYQILGDGKAVRFAAHEMSNCVWGFYRELQP